MWELLREKWRRGNSLYKGAKSAPRKTASCTEQLQGVPFIFVVTLDPPYNQFTANGSHLSWGSKALPNSQQAPSGWSGGKVTRLRHEPHPEGGSNLMESHTQLTPSQQRLKEWSASPSKIVSFHSKGWVGVAFSVLSLEGKPPTT